mmetsp:Transcript_113633/g.322218  ORF Transcript_113633/g.322218 Transcript_113633/m.322218 type:complete len:262 (+) Transcript_113633:1329-2114(+)
MLCSWRRSRGSTAWDPGSRGRRWASSPPTRAPAWPRGSGRTWAGTVPASTRRCCARGGCGSPGRPSRSGPACSRPRSRGCWTLWRGRTGWRRRERSWKTSGPGRSTSGGRCGSWRNGTRGRWRACGPASRPWPIEMASCSPRRWSRPTGWASRTAASTPGARPCACCRRRGPRCTASSRSGAAASPRRRQPWQRVALGPNGPPARSRSWRHSRRAPATACATGAARRRQAIGCPCTGPWRGPRSSACGTPTCGGGIRGGVP